MLKLNFAILALSFLLSSAIGCPPRCYPMPGQPLVGYCGITETGTRCQIEPVAGQDEPSCSGTYTPLVCEVE